MGIYQKLHQIQQSVRGLGKDKSGGQYQYVSGSKLLPVVREKMDELGVLLKQEVIAIENTRQDYTVGRDNRPKSEIHSKVSMRFTWIDVETGEKDENLSPPTGRTIGKKGLVPPSHTASGISCSNISTYPPMKTIATTSTGKKAVKEPHPNKKPSPGRTPHIKTPIPVRCCRMSGLETPSSWSG